MSCIVRLHFPMAVKKKLLEFSFICVCSVLFIENMGDKLLEQWIDTKLLVKLEKNINWLLWSPQYIYGKKIRSQVFMWVKLFPNGRHHKWQKKTSVLTVLKNWSKCSESNSERKKWTWIQELWERFWSEILTWKSATPRRYRKSQC